MPVSFMAGLTGTLAGSYATPGPASVGPGDLTKMRRGASISASFGRQQVRPARPTLTQHQPSEESLQQRVLSG
jgi:hypothetical protein